MENKPKHQEQMETVLKDLSEMLKSKGKTDKEIDQTLLELITHVEMAVVDEIYETLPEDKRKQFEEMDDAKKASGDIVEILGLDPEKTQEIEMRKFEELAGNLTSELVEEK